MHHAEPCHRERYNIVVVSAVRGIHRYVARLGELDPIVGRLALGLRAVSDGVEDRRQFKSNAALDLLQFRDRSLA